jgi:hypothetical protein
LNPLPGRLDRPNSVPQARIGVGRSLPQGILDLTGGDVFAGYGIFNGCQKLQLQVSHWQAFGQCRLVDEKANISDVPLHAADGDGGGFGIASSGQ